jgi:hypothetical protein
LGDSGPGVGSPRDHAAVAAPPRRERPRPRRPAPGTACAAAESARRYDVRGGVGRRGSSLIAPRIAGLCPGTVASTPARPGTVRTVSAKAGCAGSTRKASRAWSVARPSCGSRRSSPPRRTPLRVSFVIVQLVVHLARRGTTSRWAAAALERGDGRARRPRSPNATSPSRSWTAYSHRCIALRRAGGAAGHPRRRPLADCRSIPISGAAMSWPRASLFAWPFAGRGREARRRWR